MLIQPPPHHAPEVLFPLPLTCPNRAFACESRVLPSKPHLFSLLSAATLHPEHAVIPYVRVKLPQSNCSTAHQAACSVRSAGQPPAVTCCCCCVSFRVHSRAPALTTRRYCRRT
eukprot:710298-Rhodomonas_salina.1